VQQEHKASKVTPERKDQPETQALRAFKAYKVQQERKAYKVTLVLKG
jgi:hypothetical protein